MNLIKNNMSAGNTFSSVISPHTEIAPNYIAKPLVPTGEPISNGTAGYIALDLFFDLRPLDKYIEKFRYYPEKDFALDFRQNVYISQEAIDEFSKKVLYVVDYRGFEHHLISVETDNTFKYVYWGIQYNPKIALRCDNFLSRPEEWNLVRK